MRVNIIDKSACCGCTACQSKCPKNAINLIADDEGFKYPVVNDELCVECGLCVAVCPMISKVERLRDNDFQPNVYMVKNKSDEVRYKSSSGGVFTALYESIIQKGGAVYGARYEKEYFFKVKHDRATTIQECEQFRKSKYVQSDLSGVFEVIKDDLSNGRRVLFSGTPCQVSGLRLYLRNINIDNLYIVDMICHSVPSPLLWEEFIKYIGIKHGSQVIDFTSRYKKAGWHTNYNCYVLKNGKKYYRNKLSCNHHSLFNAKLISRPCCYSCKFTDLPHTGDLTMADFWGIENVDKAFDDNKGVSALVINTPKGRQLFEKIKDKLVCQPSTAQTILAYNHSESISMNPKRDQFWEDYRNLGYLYVAKKYADYSYSRRLVWYLKKMVRKYMPSVILHRLLKK
ncbi:Coenzyme F420 hydrogenase/dehydrogenase, beta subunit C-terminal domain [Bacteroides fragilis]|uniref:Coenzyme F420 hydrogenase/dehydrogenase, beta subunit C-terminal domain n=1 Tax=Bacteroides TaxID=816 RepID=UPI002030AB4D|nr:MULTISPECIES: Coenzyme F420 hydrogenase/dehydrogenase, beta subunit C-terminal domain [Bacteroides]MCM0323222.1 Coenzyme F420 hydrogenase/dehydrogenase, beta subunit C-terminal domain [Bacteroides fragilis]MDV6187504.1 Coenzyme F420 hydrogenase/dehydrogenase, beta subunit C-terminal domain [Bacteroides hominis (ex Liu et al. 2022)]